MARHGEKVIAKYCRECFKNLTTPKSPEDREMLKNENAFWQGSGTLQTEDGICTKCGKSATVTMYHIPGGK